MHPFIFATLLCSIHMAAAAPSVSTNRIPARATELGFTSLVQLITDAGLFDFVNGSGPFTVLAPTNDAFSAVPSSVTSEPDVLREILLYHVLPGFFVSISLSDELQLATASSVSPFARVTVYRHGQQTVQAAAVQCAPLDLGNLDQSTSNGIIHPLTAVMVPPSGDCMQYLQDNRDQFSTLISILELTGLNISLSAPSGPYTLFAPTNDAFDQIPAGDLESLMNNVPQLRHVLGLHAVFGTLCSVGIISEDVETLTGRDITLTRNSDGITVQNARVVVADGSVTNGVVHHIDQVILSEN